MLACSWSDLGQAALIGAASGFPGEGGGGKLLLTPARRPTRY
jgi:hypothetical protein